MKTILSETLSTPEMDVYEVFDDDGNPIGFNMTSTAPPEPDPPTDGVVQPDTLALAEALSSLPADTLDALKAVLFG